MFSVQSNTIPTKHAGHVNANNSKDIFETIRAIAHEFKPHHWVIKDQAIA